MKTVHISDGHYPSLLRGYKKAPPKIYYRGDESLFNSRCVAIIGTREPSAFGYSVAKKVAAYFASCGVTVVAGLANGIDTAAHRGALSVPGGKTIAILGTPLTNIYPKENTGLVEDIVNSGGLVYTEYNTNAYAPKRFFERDHLQAAQSIAVIPIQAGVNSGTLHTVNSAIEQNVLVFIPMPNAIDYHEHPAKYAGLIPYIKREGAITFRGSADYPNLLEYLQ